MSQKKIAVIEPVKCVLAAALSLAGTVSFSWGAPDGKAPAPSVSVFTAAELRQAEDECGKGTADFRKYYARFLGRPFEGALIGPEKGIAQGWRPFVRSLACLELAGDAKWSCGFFPGKGKSNMMWLRCQEAKAFSLFSKAVLRGGDAKPAFPQLLEAFLEVNIAGIPLPVQDKLFQGFSQAVKTGDVLPLCAEIGAAKLATQSECLRWAGFFTGDPGKCSAPYPEPDREDCAEKAALLSALRSSDPKACAAHPWCDLVTRRRASSCAPVIKDANSVFCGGVRDLTKGKAPPPVDTAKRDKEAKLAKEKAGLEEAARKEKERVAEFHKKRVEEEKIYREKLVATETRLAQEAAARKREQDEKVRQAREERNRKKQFRAGQPMAPNLFETMKQNEAVNSGKALPKVKEIKDE